MGSLSSVSSLIVQPSVTTGSVWSSSCCPVGIRAGKPAQNVDTVAIAISGSNRLSYIYVARVSWCPTSIHITVTA